MKILKLHFKNIHSLKGEHNIDFTLPSLSDAGLFAITGPTGSGKSTILDIITLALFSRIPRFDGKITSTEIEKIGSVMTHYTDEAYAEVEYLSNEKIYRSTWRIARARTGTLKDYEMTIATLPDGRYLDLKKSDVPAANEKIIGLNYEQFIRAILLSQGEFARFLKSDEKERAKLLEDITGSQIYRSLGKAAFEKAKEKREALSEMKQQMEAMQVLTEIEIEAKRKQLNENQQDLLRISKVLEAKNKLLTLIYKRQEAEKKLKLVQDEALLLQEKKHHFIPFESQLTKHQALEKHRGEMALLMNLKKQIPEVNKSYDQSIENIRQQDLIIARLLEKAAGFTHNEVNENNLLEKLKTFEAYITELDNRLKTLAETGSRQKARWTNLCDKYKNKYSDHLKGIKSVSEQLNYTKLEIQTLSLQYPNPDDSLVLKEKIKTNQTTVADLQDKYYDAIKREQTQLEIKSLVEEVKQTNKNLIQLQYLKDTVKTETDTLHSEIETLQRLKEKQLQMLSLEEHRQSLTEGDPCPLCGATEHPYSNNPELLRLGRSDLDLHQKSMLFQKKSQEYHTYQAEIAAAISKIETLENQKSVKEKIVTEIVQKWKESGQELTDSSVLSISITKTKEKLNELTIKEQVVADLNFLQESEEILSELAQTGMQYLKIQKDKNNLYSGSDIAKDVSALQSAYTSAKESLQEYIVHAANYKKIKENLELSIAEKIGHLMPQLQNLGYANVEEASSDLLDEVMLQQRIAQKNRLIQEEIENNTTKQNLENELREIILTEKDIFEPEALTSEIRQLTSERDNLNQASGALQNELKRNEDQELKLSEIKGIYEEKTIEAGSWFLLDNLIGDSTGNKFSKYAQNLSLKHLITLANKRLCQLSDRYLLVPSDIESDLTVMDQYQGNICRSVKTLSGGESFIVSLALALSLSDMASKNVRLDSLFIDEGFGTLDAETLETSLVTLEKLQSESNRTIGIISHVESLKERINTQIKVQKNNLGYSKLEVVS